jgi:hypothetical protein
MFKQEIPIKYKLYGFLGMDLTCKKILTEEQYLKS